MEWVQAYDPLGSALWSSLVAGSPIVVLLGLLVVGVSAPRAAAAGLATSLAVAIGVFQMPASAALASAASTAAVSDCCRSAGSSCPRCSCTT